MEVKGNRQIQHELNEALRRSLEHLKVKISPDMDMVMDIPLEEDYTRLLEAFEEHLIMVRKVNREVKAGVFSKWNLKI